MKHRILNKIADIPPYEIVNIELLAENIQEKNMITNISQEVQDYLTINLETLEIIEEDTPRFVIKKVKTDIGFGQ